MPEAYNFRLFGIPTLYAPDGSSIGLSTRARALMAFLALNLDHDVSRQAAAELIWSDRGRSQALGSLRQCLAELRSATRGTPLLDIGTVTLRLPGDRVTTDLALVEAAAEDPAAFADAVRQLGSQPPLSQPEVAPAYDEWARRQRVALDRRLTRLVHEAARALERAEQWLALRRLADLWLARAPLDEAVTAVGMRADTELGAPRDAIDRYEALARSAPAPPRTAPADASGGLPAIAVGPFTLVDDGVPFHMATGLREEVTAALSRYRDLRLFRVDLPAESMPQTKLGPRAYILTATVHRHAVVATLARPNSGRVVWSERCAIPAGDVQAVVESIVGKLLAGVLPELDRDILAGEHVAGDLYARFLAARHAGHYPADHATARAAAEALEQIIAEAPTFVSPYLPLARLYNIDFAYTRAGTSGPGERQRAFELAKRALALDRTHAHASAVVGWCHLWRGEWGVASRHFDWTRSLNPYHVERQLEVAFGSIFLGAIEEADALFARCLDLDPFPPDMLRNDLALLRIVQGDFHGAIDQLDMVTQPGIWTHVYRAAATALAGLGCVVARADLAAAFAGIDGGTAPDAARIARWVVRHRPFRVSPHRDLLLGGIELSFS